MFNVSEKALKKQSQTAYIYRSSTVDYEERDIEKCNAAVKVKLEEEIQDEILKIAQDQNTQFDIIAEELTSLTEKLTCLDSFFSLIIDPIDYTRNYVENGIEYAITALIASNGVPRICFIDFPRLKESYRCQRGCGVQKIMPQKSEKLYKRENNSSIIVVNNAVCDKINKIIGVFEIEKMHFTLRNVLQCINGSVKAVLCSHLKAYDIAPAAMIAWEVGMKVTDCNGNELLFNRASLSNNQRIQNGCIISPDLKTTEKIIKLIR